MAPKTLHLIRRPKPIPSKKSFDATIPPKTVNEYVDWLQIVYKHNALYHQEEYETVAPKLRDTFLNSDLWTSITKQLGSIDGDYYSSTGYNLLITLKAPKFLIKPWDSFLAKMFRWDVLDRQGNFNAKECNPDLWYERANDLVRTLFVVKYLDGVEMLLSFLEKECVNHQMPFRAEYKSNDDGYYAAHAYTRIKVSYPSYKGGVRTSVIEIEIQITTQLQDVLRRLTHPVYALKRNVRTISNLPWQWRYREDEFFMNYLGHSLHNIEGIIMDVRRRIGGR